MNTLYVNNVQASSSWIQYQNTLWEIFIRFICDIIAKRIQWFSLDKISFSLFSFNFLWRIVLVILIAIRYKKPLFKGSVHEKSTRAIWPSTYSYGRKKVGSDTFISTKLKFLAGTVNFWPFEQRNATTVLIYYFHSFRCFTLCKPSMANRLNYIHWVAKPQELGSGEMTLSYGSNGLQTELFTTFRATFLQIKKRNSELEWKLQ